jgi:hypothetical protein
VTSNIPFELLSFPSCSNTPPDGQLAPAATVVVFAIKLDAFDPEHKEFQEARVVE